MRRELVLSLAALSVSVACSPPMTTQDGGSGGGASGGAAGGGSVVADAGPPGDAGTLVGTFQVLHTVSEFGNNASVLGKVYDGPTPATLIWTVDLVDGDCRVEVPRAPFCATPCGGSAACVQDGVCQPYPTSKNVGSVELTGALAGPDGGTPTPFTMTPVVNAYQVPASITLAIPPFTDGAALSLQAAGSATHAPFSIATKGVAAITLDKASYPLAMNTPLEVRWTAGSAATAAHIEVELDISHHGGLRGQIVCNTADDGSLTIGAGLASRLIALGVSGFPTMVVRRVKTDFTVVSAGRIDFSAVSQTEVRLDIPGLVSCTDPTDCPMGQTCQTDLRCQ